jgi:protein gp37
LNTYDCGGTRRRIRLFADSNSDWLDERWPIETLARFLNEIRLAPNLDVLLLTKRIEDFSSRLTEVIDAWPGLNLPKDSCDFVQNWLDGKAPSNIWLGVSIEDQPRADERIPLLLQTPAAVRFLSVEPLLTNVNLGSALNPCAADCHRKIIGSPPLTGHWHKGIETPLLHWVIVGAESGPNRRDCGVEAIVSVADQCIAAGIPCWVKQDCARFPGQQGRIPGKYWALKQFPKP